MKDKVILTKELLKKLVKYYRFDFSESDYDKFNHWECFSHPSLELHQCNARANLPGNRVCNVCNGDPEVPCTRSCDIQGFCMAAFAWRLGIGGEDFDKSLQKNLYKKDPDKLYNEVTIVLSCGIDALSKEEESLGVFVDSVLNPEEPEEIKHTEKVPDNYISLYRASKDFNYTYTGLKTAGEKRKFTIHKVNGRSYVDPVEVKTYIKDKKTKSK